MESITIVVILALSLIILSFSIYKVVNLKEQLSLLNVDRATLSERVNNLLSSQDELKELNTEYSDLKDTLADANITISSLQTKLEEQQSSTQEKLQLLQENEEQLKKEFKNLATEILDSNSKKFSSQHQESLGLILNPMKQQLNEFKKKVEDVYEKEAKDRSALQNELKSLKELNLKISTDATNLTNALKGQSKQQGIWGEMVLEKVLESSGLREGHEFRREVSLKDEDNNTFRPDVIVNLPDERHIIIDAKNSLNAYTKYIACEDEDEKKVYLKAHVSAIYDHVKKLSAKKYENLKDVNSLDFIFMFVPIESALMLALDSDVNLYDEAFKQKIILVSPTTLLVALRAVENTWRYEKQAQNIANVYDRAEKLYTKFVNFVADLEKVGKSLEVSTKSYNDAFSKLSTGSGNLVTQATELKKVSNIKPKKELPKELIENS
ncbi:MAG: DNA recombination protein RmuC [Helicobacteraceae bacterium]|nr:DNA recombination protein RmuC [Helicobacteraceae bacterium]